MPEIREQLLTRMVRDTLADLNIANARSPDGRDVWSADRLAAEIGERLDKKFEMMGMKLQINFASSVASLPDMVSSGI